MKHYGRWAAFIRVEDQHITAYANLVNGKIDTFNRGIEHVVKYNQNA